MCWARAASGAACRWARAALRALQAWLAQRAHAGQARAKPALFVSRRGTRLTPNQVRHAPARRRRCRPACRRTCTRTCCATASPATCCSPAATCARCRNCWATPTSARRRSIPSSTSSTWPRSTTRRIRGRGASPAVHEAFMTTPNLSTVEIKASSGHDFELSKRSTAWVSHAGRRRPGLPALRRLQLPAAELPRARAHGQFPMHLLVEASTLARASAGACRALRRAHR